MERRSSLAKEQAANSSNVKRREESASDKLAAIQSIANVLNHHAQQLTRYEQNNDDDDDDERVETRQVSTLATQQESEANAQGKAQVDQLAGRPSLTLFASDDEFAPSQSIKVTADKWPPEQLSKGSGSGQQQQQQRRRPAGKLKRQLSARARAVDHQYLYAYNNSAAFEQTSADLLAHETNTNKNSNPANGHATRVQRLTGLRKAGEEEEEEGEHSNEDDTLSCCVERSARQEEGDLLLFAAHERQLISDKGNSKAENLNHLRAYLQIEENFNSYRAAKQRHINQAGASSSTSTSSAAPARKLDPHQHQHHHHLHLPLANYIIATNEQRLPAGEESAQNVARGHQQAATLSSTSCTSLNQQQQLISQQDQQTTTTNHQNYLEILKFAVTPTKTKFAGAASKLIGKSSTSGAMGNFKMYSSEQPNLNHAHAQQHQHQHQHQQQLVVGSLAGQPGAYYVMGGSQQSSSDGSDESPAVQHVNSDNLQTPSGHQLIGAHQHHLHHSHLHHPHHTHHLNQHQQHYHHTHHYQAQPLGASASASDSSLGSSGAFASSAMRATSGWLRDFCSKKCLFVACLLLIMFIFILVISLTAYLNFLITTSKTNLQPLSGRLRVDMAAQELWPAGGGGSEIMGAAQANKSSVEFLARQRDFETIIRGALDRTQATLKSYPNHLVKLEVYSIMKLPNLIVTSGGGGGGGALSGLWVHFRLFLNKRTLQHDTQLMRRKSPDEQFERQFLPRLTQQTLHSGFEQLLASSGRLISTTSTGSDQLTSEAIPPPTPPLGINSRRFGAGSTSAQIDSTETTRRLATRATPSAQSTTQAQTQTQTQTQTTTRNSNNNNNVNSQMLKSFDEQMNRLMHLIEAIDLQSILVTPEFDMTQTMAGSPGATSGALQVMSETLRASQPIITSTPANVTVATQPVTRAPEVSSSTTKFTLGPNYRENSTRPTSSPARESPFLLNQNQKKVVISTTTTTTTPPVRLVEGRPVIASQPPVVTQQSVNRKLTNSTTTRPIAQSPVLISSTSPASIGTLWTNTLNNQNVSTLELSSTSSTTTSASTTPNDSTRRRVITVSENAKAPVSASSSDWQRVATSSQTMAPVNASWQQQVTSSTSAPQTSSTRAPKVSPHLNFAGSLIAATTNGRADNSNARRAQKAQESAVILRDANQANQTPSGQVSTQTTTTTTSVSNITIAPTISSTTTTRRPKQKQKQKQQQARAPSTPARNGTSSSVVKLTTAKPAKAKKVALSSSTPSLDNSTLAANNSHNSTTLKGIRIVDDFLATQSNKPATTLPTTTTIELTRSSTSAQPAARTTPMSITTAPPTTSTSTQSANDFVVSNQQARPGTTSFSGQWRPIADTDFWSAAAPAARVNRTSGGGRSPSSGSNLSLIVATERLPPTLNQAHGSQSPFAMPSLRGQQPTTSGFANRFRAPANDFESRRVSRMRQSQAHAQRSNESGDQFGGSSSTMSSASSTSTTTTSTTTTSSSLNFGDPNTRIVDDFMITADPNEGANGRGATLIPPLVMSTLHRPEVATSEAAAAKRTRGPFAFETLRSLAFETPPQPPTPLINTLDPLDFEPTAASTRAERSPEVQQRAVTDEKLLVRKQLFLDEPEVSQSRADFGNRKWRRSSQACPHFGCRARDSQEFVCLNRTQICDDFTDCMDSSDELDCVSLLKLDPSTNSMRFSNGAGIVYLNRRGALAPMCIDHYHPHLSPSDGSGSGPSTEASGVAQSRATHSAHELEAVQLRAAMRRQNELIRQVNTIGQYACSLQSFSRLVSVKINHHDQVDGLDLIKSAGLFHTLTIGDGTSGNSSSSSFKSAGYEVEIGSSSECPSQRTVFVKCGAFECGQDSFSVPATSREGDQQPTSTIVSDFPWLVKLYLNDLLACQGYLIDESWLLAARACLANKSLLADNNWTAEISHEHYDDMTRRTRRRVKDIHVPASQVGNEQLLARDGSAIVLAKLDRPVRFSPLNRPICLPLASAINNNNNSSLVESDNNYTDCISLTLPLNYNYNYNNNNKPVRNLNLDSTSPPTHSNTSPTPTHLVFNKVKLIRAEECLNGRQTVTPSGGDFVCAIDEEINQTNNNNNNNDADDHDENTTRVLICAPKQRTSTGNNRPRWTVVGVQSTTTPTDATLKPKRRLYARVSSQLDWIVDTMNPKSNDTHSNPIEGGESFELMIANSNRTHTTRQAATLNELNPFDSLNQAHHQRQQQQQQPDGACTSFKCSTGECLSWSRICDGLYDCSSHDDERDCHR